MPKNKTLYIKGLIKLAGNQEIGKGVKLNLLKSIFHNSIKTGNKIQHEI
jgi:hypothetical protein